MKPLKILFISSEIDPFAKAGGLADVSRSLPKALKRLGHDVKIIMPKHGCINEEKHQLKVEWERIPVKIDGEEVSFGVKKAYLMEDLPVFFIDKHSFFGGRKYIYSYEDDNKRYMFFNFAALKIPELLNWQPDIIHCHDWLSGLIPYLIRTKQLLIHPLFKKTATVFTIHNLAFQYGNSPYFNVNSIWHKGSSGLPKFSDDKAIASINFMKKGIIGSEILTTVSESYAKEITSKENGAGLHRLLNAKKYKLYGIINGIDYSVFNPSLDENIAVKYDFHSLDKKTQNKIALQKEFGLPQNPDVPVIGLVTRITEQKGFDLICPLLSHLAKQDLQLIIVGEGDKKYYKYFREAQKQNPEKFGIHLEFNTERASRIFAGSDLFLMPSRFEPCGLTQMISLRYGSIPIVRNTGGLSDTITDFNIKSKTGNGFVFTAYNKMDLFAEIIEALACYKLKKTWNSLVKNVMKQSFSWEIPAQKYTEIYKKAISRKKYLIKNRWLNG